MTGAHGILRMASAPWWNWLDIFFTANGEFCVWVKALGNDVNTDLT